MILFLQKSSKFKYWLLTKSWNHLSFVNISPTLLIDTSMERSSRVIHHGNPKIWSLFQKSSKFEFRLLTKSWNQLTFVNISPTIVNWNINGMVFTSTTPWKPRKVNFFKKFEIFCPYPDFSYAEKKSPWLRQYQSYISNWYVNGKVFTSTTTWEPKYLIFFFFKKVRNWIRLVFWLVLKSWNHSSRSQHAPICQHRGCIVVPLRVDIYFNLLMQGIINSSLL